MDEFKMRLTPDQFKLLWEALVQWRDNTEDVEDDFIKGIGDMKLTADDLITQMDRQWVNWCLNEATESTQRVLRELKP